MKKTSQKTKNSQANSTDDLSHLSNDDDNFAESLINADGDADSGVDDANYNIGDTNNEFDLKNAQEDFDDFDGKAKAKEDESADDLDEQKNDYSALFGDDDETEEEEAPPKIDLQQIFAPYMELKFRQAAKLNKYRTYLIKKNQRVNLTAITDEYQIAVKHFLDSALGAQFVPQNATLCDIGSGAGFPAVVLKILRKDIQITMVDSVGKKVEFLRRLCKKLNLEAERFNARAEQLAITRRETFDVATARAVAPLATLLEYLAPLVRVGGVVIAYKGVDAATEIAAAKTAATTLGLTLLSQNDFVLPDDSKRTIVVYKKIERTPRKFPRGQGLPKKSPIA